MHPALCSIVIPPRSLGICYSAVSQHSTLFVTSGRSGWETALFVFEFRFRYSTCHSNAIVIIHKKTIFFSKIAVFFSNIPEFSQTFRLFRRRPIRSNLFAGFLRAARAIGRPMSATRFGDRSLHMILLLHGICTGPANRATVHRE